MHSIMCHYAHGPRDIRVYTTLDKYHNDEQCSDILYGFSWSSEDEF